MNEWNLNFKQKWFWIWEIYTIRCDASVQIVNVDANNIRFFDNFDIIGRQIGEFRLNDQMRGGHQ